MFSKGSSGKEPEGAAPAPAKRGRAAPSIISSDMIVKGDLMATGDIQIDGTVEGDVRSNTLTVGEKAAIRGEIAAEEAIIRGRVMGSIKSRRVQLCNTCHVEGDILHQALSVETGAFFEGACRHSDDPLAQKKTVDGAPPVAKEKPASPEEKPAKTEAAVVVKDGDVVLNRSAAE